MFGAAAGLSWCFSGYLSLRVWVAQRLLGLALRLVSSSSEGVRGLLAYSRQTFASSAGSGTFSVSGG